MTHSGQLFCQGEDLRLYADSDVNADTPATDFVNCTDVFPTEAGDQIVDVAAGHFYTVVITESGAAYGVGTDRGRKQHMQRRRYPGEPQI